MKYVVDIKNRFFLDWADKGWIGLLRPSGK